MELAFLSELNERQREAVTSPDGATLVLAGAGSGKTRVITYRIAYRIATGADPGTILAVTFTNKAADEMRRRVRELVRRPESELAVHTFHALCLRLLRRFGEDVGLRPGFAVYGEDERRSLLRRICQESRLAEREFPLSRVAAAVSARKTQSFDKRGGSLDAFASSIGEVADRYQEALAQAGAVDFDDLLLRGVELFECSDRTQSFAGRRFQHVLVDEYQDTNRLQYRLLRLLAPHGNLFVVGDEDQSIYNFRGADLRNILDFERDFPDARVVKLEMNYRSTAAILRAASAVIDHNLERKGKRLVAILDEGEKIELFEAEDERDEAERVAGAIERLRHEEELRSVAVLLRTHAQTRAFEEELVRRGIPHRVVGGLRFFERREIRDALAYLRLVLNRDDDGAFRRVVNVPSRGVGAATLALVERQAAQGGGVSLWNAALQLLDSDSLPGRARSGLTSFRSTVEGLSERLPRDRPAESTRRAIDETGLSRAIAEEGQGAAERRENLDQLVASAVEYEQDDSEPTLAGFLDAVSLLTDADTLEAQTPCLLMTIHAAKGLEFDVVFLAGLEEGLFPHVRASGDRRALEEERRLFYVALTRARKRLFLSYSRSRRGSYSSSSRSPSRFLGEIPSDLLRGSTSTTAGSVTGVGSPYGALRPGVVVLHKTFGEGRVVEASGSGKDRKVTVIFRHAGRKRLLAHFAQLEVLA